MNILFVLYGGFGTNSANPMVLYARELHKRGHECVIAVPSGLDTVTQHGQIFFRPALYDEVLKAPLALFSNGQLADIIHACTPREVVREFITTYQARNPTPLLIYLEDNESWIASHALGFDENTIVQLTESDITSRLPKSLSHPFLVDYFVGLADAAVVIQSKLKKMVPTWVYCEDILIGIDTEFFSPRPADRSLFERYQIPEGHKLIVYHGGMNKFNRSAIRDLSEAAGLINERGVPCKLVRCGPNALDYLDEISPQAALATIDLGILPKETLPDLLALADVLVQPGRVDEFEEYRLPGKVPEFLAMGLPVVMPRVNISHLFVDGTDAVLMQSGTPDEIAEKCIALFSDTEKCRQIGRAGRLLAQKYFDVRKQSEFLEKIYLKTCAIFNPGITREVWSAVDRSSPAYLVALKLDCLAKLPSIEKQTRDLLFHISNQIRTDSKRISSSENQILDYRLQIKGFRAMQRELEGRIHELEKKNNALELVRQELEAVYLSTSWRITKPLRTGVEKLRQYQAQVRNRLHSIRFMDLVRFILPYYHRYAPDALRKLIPDKLRRTLLRRIDGIDGKSTAYGTGKGTTEFRIVYVINYVDRATQRYRVFNYAEELSDMGLSSKIIYEDKLTVEDVLAANLVVFNRISWSENLDAVFHALKQYKISSIFDVDDLIFNPDAHHLLRGLKTRDEDARNNFLEAMHKWRRTLLECDAVTVSTFALKSEVEKLGKFAFVLPNTISRTSRKLADDCIKAGTLKSPARIDIGYFSGTRTHEVDFMVCKAALLRVLQENANVRFHIVGELEGVQEFEQFQERFVRHPLMKYEPMLELLSGLDIALAPLELNNIFTDCKSELKLFEPALFSIPCIASPTSSYAAIIDHGRNGMLAATVDEWYKGLSRLVTDAEFRRNLGKTAHETICRRYYAETAVKEALSVYRRVVAGGLPSVADQGSVHASESGKPVISVVAILYNKQDEVRYFLESLRRQALKDSFEIILIDDDTPDKSVHVVEQYLYWKKFYAKDLMQVRLLKNERNLGNCASRNLGIQNARADVVLIVDADCVFNSTFLESHIAAHASGYCDVAIGPRGIETGNTDPFSYLAAIEADDDRVRKEGRLQDPINPDSFVNCVTRNFSIKRSLAEELRFDDDFAYKASPESGFGWEDVELGCRLYEKSARIWYLADTVSLHVTHPTGAEDKSKPVRSLRNFRRLHEKHPELMLASRQWTNRTWHAIKKWADTNGADISENPDALYLTEKFKSLQNVPVISLPGKPLRILTHRWHISHQYELYRLGHQFDLVTGAGTRMCDSWSRDVRPMPHNAGFIPYQMVNPADYDLMILHFDENILHPERCNNKVPMDWGRTFTELLKLSNQIPTIAICHGTPQFAGQYDIDYKDPDLGTVVESSRMEITNLLRNVTVVCNSWQSEQEWGFAKSKVIWHGFSPHDFPKGRHDRHVGLMLERALSNRPHYNGYFICREVLETLLGKVDCSYIEVPTPNLSSPVELATAKFHNYARELGRFSIYLNPTVRSPMPRIRGEAMMTGAVSVSLRNHDVDKFIDNGINGFYADSAAELADQILYLNAHPDVMAKISVASRQTAMDIFNHDRYLSAWTSLINETTGQKVRNVR